MITAEQRIRMIILIEKMNKQKTYSKKLGVEDRSKFHGKTIHKEESEIIC